MKQTRKASLAESLMNVVIGYGISLASPAKQEALL
jgi:hypothetical protein